MSNLPLTTSIPLHILLIPNRPGKSRPIRSALRNTRVPIHNGETRDAFFCKSSNGHILWKLIGDTLYRNMNYIDGTPLTIHHSTLSSFPIERLYRRLDSPFPKFDYPNAVNAEAFNLPSTTEFSFTPGHSDGFRSANFDPSDLLIIDEIIYIKTTPPLIELQLPNSLSSTININYCAPEIYSDVPSLYLHYDELEIALSLADSFYRGRDVASNSLDFKVLIDSSASEPARLTSSLSSCLRALKNIKNRSNFPWKAVLSAAILGTNQNRSDLGNIPPALAMSSITSLTSTESEHNFITELVKLDLARSDIKSTIDLDIEYSLAFHR